MKKKIAIVSGSLHQIPPQKNSAAVPRIMHQYAEFLQNYYDVTVISIQEGSIEKSYQDKQKAKYLIIERGFIFKLLIGVLKLIPYKIKKAKFGKANEKFNAYWMLVQWHLRKEKPDYVLTTMHIDAIPFMYRACPNASHFFFFRSSNLELENADKVKRISKLLKGVVTLTNEAQDYVKREILPNQYLRTQVVPNFVDLDKFNLSIRNQKRESARNTYGINQHDFVLGYAGRLTASKGLLKIVKVLKSLMVNHPNIKLLIAGDQKIEATPDSGSEYQEIVSTLSKIPPGVIVRPGWIPNSDMPLFYSALDVSLLLSKEREGHSMFGMESMASGVPVIATKIGGNLEIVVDGVSGFLISADDDGRELEALILKLINNQSLYRELSQGAYLNIRDRFNFDSSSSKLLSVFKD